MSVLVGKQAPDFTSSAVMSDNSINDKFNFRNYTKGKVAVLFFWPADFSFVCPSEIIAFNNKMSVFESKKVAIVGCSIDSQFVHYAWKGTPVEKGGIGSIKFPMVADMTGEIAKQYDILSDAKLAYRATFLIDQTGKVVHQLVNDLPLGRNIDEVIRMIDALLFTQQYGEVCPANWKKGEEGIKPTAEGVAEYLSKHAVDL
ncbi:MAG: peroxiredoxin [Rickettsiales bacterium]|nr:peroxiredoxin [Rickettsiales bacterium]